MEQKKELLSGIEECIICRCMEMSATEIISSGLTPEDFNDYDHGNFFRAIIKASCEGLDCDIATIGSMIDPNKIQKLVTCSESKTTKNMNWMVKTVRDVANSKRNIRKLYTIYNEAIDQLKTDPLAIYPLAEKLSFIHDSFQSDHKVDTIKGGLLMDTIKAIEEDYASGGINAIKTGIPEIDQVLGGGLKPRKLITIAARPGCGKTALATNMLHAVSKAGKHGLYITIELDSKEIVERLLCLDGKINTVNMSNRKLEDNHFDALGKSVDRMKDFLVSVDSKTGGSWERAAMTIRNQASYNGVNVVFLDYVQQFRTQNKKASMRENISEITSQCKTLAMELNICIVMIAQLNRDIDKRNDKTPLNSDLKESGSIEQDSDVVIMLSFNSDEKSEMNETGLWAYVTKNRQGNVAKHLLKHDFAINKFFG